MSDTNPASGTRDFLAQEVRRRQRAFATVREVFERHGFEPLDTPAFERLDVLLGKYGEEGDKLIFKILRRGEHEATGEADLALRYDLTVPLARVVAQYSDEIIEPYKRYHIAPVWRADRPGKGRFREFVQCDIDVVGSDDRLADVEVMVTVAEALDALGVRDFELAVNSRLALHGLVEAYGIPEELEETAFVALDKFDKIGPDGVAAELRERDVPPDVVEDIEHHLHAEDVRGHVRELLMGNERGKAGLAELDEVIELVRDNIPTGTVSFAPFLARGLSYYTGPIFETFAPGLGSSIASGGRYDDLVGMFTARDISACGGSIGLERVLEVLDDDDAATSSTAVLVTVFDDEGRADAVRVAGDLRTAGLDVDLYVGDGDRLGKQLRYADRKGMRYCVVRGPDEREAGTAAVKDLVTGDQEPVGLDSLADHIRRLQESHE